ncbi:DUF6731 family protein [Stenotrophomonas pavanii]|uniref:DUF6731 family protein n=1 Tax=Stenotrophomonas pavanii TaxID=487698 RepID=UPI002895978D|nr:DUF6731 family protein [Stenotrophomonas pavanii]MDT3530256.1 DUF6731 family protein [Stenotrophomonas pavanii]
MPKYKIEFYEAEIVATGSMPDMPSAMGSLMATTMSKVFEDSGITREVFDIEQRAGRFTGSLRKFRHHDLPEIGTPGFAAHEIDLNDDQGLIEKNFWALYESHSIVLWHANGNANSAKQFERTLTHLLGTRVHLTPLIRQDALRRLMDGSLVLKSLEVSVPRPRNTSFYPEDEWNQSIMNAMAAAEGDRIKVTITSDSRIDKNAHLANRMKNALAELVRGRSASTVKAVVQEDGMIHPIDLLADRLISTQEIEHDGRYPNKEGMYGAFDAAFQEEQESIVDVLGEGGTRIR